MPFLSKKDVFIYLCMCVCMCVCTCMHAIGMQVPMKRPEEDVRSLGAQDTDCCELPDIGPRH